MKGAACGVPLACSMRSLVAAMMMGNAKEFLIAPSNGIVSFVGLIGICETHFAVQILTKALAAYGVKENGEKFLNAVKKGDATEILVSGLNLTMDIVTLFSSCFDGDTPVATETGFRRIDEIRAGDRVWSYNVETGERALKEVKEVLVRENDELLHIETSRGVVDATTSHPFYVVGKGWVAAGDLAVGDGIQAISGDAGIVTGLKLEKLDKPISVYNLDVEDFHSYFVADGVLVHNGCKPGDAKRAVDKKQGPPSVRREIERIDGPESSVSGSQWHAHGKNGGGLNLDGEFHEGDPHFSGKVLKWLKKHGRTMPKRP